ncbi:MAG TPA: hypothetical protein DCZ95_09985 [Verrucomicrobia bacterium]|nr:MAG: hypothetical protein A2X46_00205 [Lentisphaerae bacterium GWF2_57_35]HBA84410.1 hypothetical protein [Verrucomicrobiota bacterium]
MGAVLLAGLLLAGCVKVDQTLTLEADGSGVVQLAFGVSEQTAAQMDNLARETGIESEQAFPSASSEEDIRQDFKEYEPLGVSLESVQTETIDGWKYRRLKIRFASLEGLAQTPLMSERPMSLRRLPDGNYELLQAVSEQVLPETAPDANAQDFMKGFHAVLRFRMPGTILESSAPEHSGNEASWVFDLAQDPDAIKKAEKATIRIVFSGKGLNNIPEFQKTSTDR